MAKLTSIPAYRVLIDGAVVTENYSLPRARNAMNFYQRAINKGARPGSDVTIERGYYVRKSAYTDPVFVADSDWDMYAEPPCSCVDCDEARWQAAS